MASSRHFAPGAEGPACNLMEELLTSLNRVNTFNPPVHTCSTGWKFSGLYSGPTSIAFLFYRLSKIYPDLTFKSQSLEDWAISYLELGSSYLTGDRHGRAPVDPDHCGVANETLAQLAIRAVVYEDDSLLQQLCSYSAIINRSNGGSDEWLYGRAGYLYLLRLARSAFFVSSHATLNTQVSRAISETTDRILISPRPWKWHGRAYLGAVHGTAGIITQLLLSSPDPSSLVARLTPYISNLLSQQFPSGNFPSSLPSPGDSPSDRLVQFCHGAPGVILALHPLIRLLPTDLAKSIRASITTAQPTILERGLLTKSPCLCHGIPTNALALSSDKNFLAMLSHMSSDHLEANAEWMAQAGMQDSFAGLYTGEAGRAWAWAVAEQVEAKGGNVREEMGIIGFSDV